MAPFSSAEPRMRPMGPGGMMQLGRITVDVCDAAWYEIDAVTISKPHVASGSGLPVLEVHQAERDNCILAVSF